MLLSNLPLMRCCANSIGKKALHANMFGQGQLIDASFRPFFNIIHGWTDYQTDNPTRRPSYRGAV